MSPACPPHGRLVHTLFGVLLLFSFVSLAGADEITRKSDVPPAVDKPAPENVADLRAIQTQVNKVLDKVVPCTVGIIVGGSSGSGVIIDKEGTILTAGHVSGKPGQDCILIFHDGKRVKGKTLGQNKGIDSGMIKIVEEGNYPFVEMGSSVDLKKGQWVISCGHPGGYKVGRSPVVRLGRVLDNTSTIVRTDCTLVGGDSGGPLFDMNGKVVGIHSRIGPTLQSNIHVPIDTYRDTFDRLVKGDSWGGGFFARENEPYLGLTVDVDGKDVCKVTAVRDNGPASKAGFKAGDIILKFDNRPVGDSNDLDIVLKPKKPGDEVEVLVKRGDEKVTLKMTIGSRSR
jgi:serine protease Do